MATPITTDKLYDICVETEKNLEKITTELGKMGADEKAVKFFEQAADATRQVCQALAKNMQQEEPPAEGEAEAEGEQPAGTMDEAADRMMARREAE